MLLYNTYIWYCLYSIIKIIWLSFFYNCGNKYHKRTIVCSVHGIHLQKDVTIYIKESFSLNNIWWFKYNWKLICFYWNLLINWFKINWKSGSVCRKKVGYDSMIGTLVISCTVRISHWIFQIFIQWKRQIMNVNYQFKLVWN